MSVQTTSNDLERLGATGQIFQAGGSP